MPVLNVSDFRPSSSEPVSNQMKQKIWNRTLSTEIECTFSFYKLRNYIINWITTTRKFSKHCVQNTEQLDSCFNLMAHKLVCDVDQLQSGSVSALHSVVASSISGGEITVYTADET